MFPNPWGQYHDPICFFFSPNPKFTAHFSCWDPPAQISLAGTGRRKRHQHSGLASHCPAVQIPWSFFSISLIPALHIRWHQKARNCPKKEQSPECSRRWDGVNGLRPCLSFPAVSPCHPAGIFSCIPGVHFEPETPKPPTSSSSAPNRAEHCSNFIKIWDFFGVKCGPAPAPTPGPQDGGTDPTSDCGMGHNPGP